MNAKDYDLSSVKPEVVERAKKGVGYDSIGGSDDPEAAELLEAIAEQQGKGGIMDVMQKHLDGYWQPPSSEYVYAECKLVDNCYWGFDPPWKQGNALGPLVEVSISVGVSMPGWAGVTDERGERWERNPNHFLVIEGRTPHRVRFNRQKLIDAGVIKEDSDD